MAKKVNGLSGKRATPLLLKLQWKGFPLAYSKEHGWCYRMTGAAFDEMPTFFDSPSGCGSLK
jgi:hypothetical protein